MGKTVMLKIQVPAEKLEEYQKWIHSDMIKSSYPESLIYKVIKENPDLTLAKIAYKLKNKHKIRRSIEGLKKIAKWCELPYAE